jgi:hypothetical protein
LVRLLKIKNREQKVKTKSLGKTSLVVPAFLCGLAAVLGGSFLYQHYSGATISPTTAPAKLGPGIHQTSSGRYIHIVHTGVGDYAGVVIRRLQLAGASDEEKMLQASIELVKNDSDSRWMLLGTGDKPGYVVFYYKAISRVEADQAKIAHDEIFDGIPK